MPRAAFSVLVILFPLVVALVPPPAAAEPSCYQGPCAWDRADEERLRARAESEAGAVVTPGSTYTARVDELRDSGALRILGPNVTAYNRTWDLLVVRDHRCGEATALALADLVVPGYPGVAEALANASGVEEENGTLSLALCGTQYAGVPAGMNASVGGGTLRLQTGRGFDLTVRLPEAGLHATFPFWAGLVVEDTLSVTRVGEGAFLVSTTLRATVLVEGDLGWGSGDVRIDVLPAWERVLSVTTTDCCAFVQDVAHGAAREPPPEAVAGASAAARPVAALASPLRVCGALLSRTGYPCQLVAKATAAPAILTDRASGAWRERARVDGGDVAAAYDGLCHGVEGPCLAAPGGAVGLRVGGRNVTVEDRTEAWTVGPGGSVDHALGAELERADPDGAVADLAALTLSMDPGAGEGETP